jgi:hypothetical protein
MSNSATPDTIFNNALCEAFEALKVGANDLIAGTPQVVRELANRVVRAQAPRVTHWGACV